MKTPQLRYVLYARKSSEDDTKQVQSIEDQIKWAEKFARERKLKLIKPYFTEAKSAKKPGNRPEFIKAITEIENGRADGILSWELSRLSRNPIDSGEVQWLLQEGVLKSIMTNSREYLPEDNTILFAVESAADSEFIRKLKINTRRGIRSKAAKGWFPHMAPIGYLNDDVNLKGEKVIFADKERWEYVRRIWDLMLTGNYNPKQILAIITEEGLRTRKTRKQGGGPVTESGIYRILTNLFYTGWYTFNDEEIKGKHKPMITRQEFEYVQALLGKRGKPRPQKHEFSYTGLLKCGECGSSITAETKRKLIKSTTEIKQFTYYRCTKKKRYTTCSQKPIRLENLEGQIEPTVADISIMPEFKDWALEVLAKDNKQQFDYLQKVQKTLRSSITSTEKELYDLNKTYTRGKLDDDFYEQEKAELKAEIKKLNRDLRDSETTAEQQITLSENVFKFACNARKRFTEGDVRTRREILSALGANFTLTDGELKFERHKWITLLSNEYPELEQQLQVARTKKTPDLHQELSNLKLTWGE